MNPNPAERTGSGPTRFLSERNKEGGAAVVMGLMLEMDGETKVLPLAGGLVRAVMFIRVMGTLGAG